MGETVIPLATPFIVFVDPASSCNFKCTFCPTGHRDMIAETGRFQGVMKLEVFQKIIDDLGEFEKPIKVLRMYKDGEPFLNKRMADMVAYARKSGHVDYINYGPAVFWHIRDLVVGDEVQIRLASGTVYKYRVIGDEAVPANPTQEQLAAIVGPSDKEIITMITCTGTFNYTTHEYDQRHVVRAERVLEPLTVQAQ